VNFVIYETPIVVASEVTGNGERYDGLVVSGRDRQIREIGHMDSHRGIIHVDDGFAFAREIGMEFRLCGVGNGLARRRFERTVRGYRLDLPMTKHVAPTARGRQQTQTKNPPR